MHSQFDPLEPRTLLAASLSGGVLTITPDRRSNTILVSATAGAIELRDNGTLRQFNGGAVRSIVIRGGSAGDRIDGTSTPVPITIFGGRGDDVITGGGVNDQVFGGPGNDRLRGGAGGDVLSGEDGADTVSYDDRRLRIVVTAGDGRGNDGHVVARRSEGDDVRNDVEVIVGGPGNDRITAGSGRSTLFGGDGDDVLVGGDNDDVLVGQDGDDFLDGGAGNDVLIGTDRSFDDNLVGGPGFDIAIMDPLRDDSVTAEFVQRD